MEQDLIYMGIIPDNSMSVDHAQEIMTEEEYNRMQREKYDSRSELKR